MKQNLLNKLWLQVTVLVALMCTATGAWAQSDFSSDYEGNVTLSTTGGTSATDCKIRINNVDYDGIKAGTGKISGKMVITVPSGTKYLHLHVAAWNGETVTLSVTPEEYSDEIALTANSGISNSSPFAFYGAANTEDYYKVITFAEALTEETALTFTATSGRRFVVWGVTAEEEGTNSPLASISVDASQATTVFYVGDEFTNEGVVVTAYYEDQTTKNVTNKAEFSGYDMSKAGVQEVTVSYTENEVTKTNTYNITVKAPATLTGISLSGDYPTEFTQGDAFSSEGIVVTANYDDQSTKDVTEDATFEGYDMSKVGAQTVTVSYEGKTATYDITVNEYVEPSELTVDFESALSTYREWEFTNAVKSTGDITAHGGTYYGTTGGKATAAFQTKSKRANPGIFTCYVSKQSNNTTASTWYIQVSSDGSEWEEVASQSATSMTKGEWVEFTADLSDYSDVYVRLYYSGSTAVRNVDDITLTTAEPKVLASIALSGDYPTTFHVGDAFSYEGIVVTANYEDQTTKDVTASAEFTGYDMETIGAQTVTVSYTEGEVTKTATYDITVNAPATLLSISLSGTYPTEFGQGDAFSSEGIVVTANYDDQSTKNVTEDATFTGYDMDVLGEQTVTVSYEGQEATYTITVVEKKGTATNPYTVAEAVAYIGTLGSATSATEVYVSGIISQVDSFNSKYGSITYWISDDGTTEGQMEVYSGLNINGEQFSAKDDLQVGDIVTVKGYVKMYDTTPEFDKNNQLESFERPVDTTPSIDLDYNEINAFAEGTDGVISVSYKNITNVAADVFFCDAEGNAATYEWVAASINANNNLEYIINENTSTEARTAYMKVYALDDETNYVYSELITINQAGVVVDYATLPFSFNAGRAAIADTNGMTEEGLNTKDYSAANTKLKFDSTGDYVVLKLNEEPGVLFFDISGNSFSDGTFTVQTSADGETYANLRNYKGIKSDGQTEAFALDANVRYIKWVYTAKANGNVGLGNIFVDKVQTATVGEAGYATYVAKYNVSFPEGVEAYIATSTGYDQIKEEEYVSLTKVTSVAKGTPVVLKKEGEFTLTPVADPESAEGNLLKASDGTVEGNGTIYVLAKPAGKEVGFYAVQEGTTVAEGKAYLEIANADVKSFAFSFADQADGINEVNGQWSTANGQSIYNLAGQRIQKMQKGINIVNGKKVVLK